MQGTINAVGNAENILLLRGEVLKERANIVVLMTSVGKGFVT